MHHARRGLQGRGGAAVASLAPDSPFYSRSVPCAGCGHLAFLCTVVAAAERAKAPHEWARLCLDCAAAAPGCGPGAVLFEHPAWADVVAAARELEGGVRPLQGRRGGRGRQQRGGDGQQPAGLAPAGLQRSSSSAAAAGLAVQGGSGQRTSWGALAPWQMHTLTHMCVLTLPSGLG